MDLSKLTANGYEYHPPIYSLGCILIRIGWFKHCFVFKNIHFIWLGAFTMLTKDPLKPNNTRNTCFVSPTTVLYHS